jgi:adenylate cyclase
MALEIERKFLVSNDSWKAEAGEPVRLCQKYVPLSEKVSGVIRLRIAGDRGFLTMKTPQKGISRGEFEYEIPVEDAESLMQQFCPSGGVGKLRYIVNYAGFRWEIDEFLGRHTGLVLAEIELPSEDAEFPLPPWIGTEVSGDFHYSNSYLSEHDL